MRKTGLSYMLITACVAHAGVLAFDAAAQSYPSRPIRIVVGFAAGGATDLSGRMVAQKLSERLGQPGVVETRAGASGMIAAQTVAKAPADGYMLLLTSASDTILPALRASLPYDLDRDFAPVSLVAGIPTVLVIHPSVPARTLKELIAIARVQPGRLSYGSSGVGASSHLAGELFNTLAKVSAVHVPYQGASAFVLATAAGQIDMSFSSGAAALPVLNAGKVRALAVTTLKRAGSMPSIPTLDESGVPGYEYFNWNGVSAPAGTPRDIIARLNAVIVEAVNTAEMKEAFARQGLEAQTNTPEQFALLIRSQIAQNAKLIKATGAKPE